MAFILSNRVKETATSPGTGTVTLSGASSGYQSFSAGIGANNTTYYVIADQTGANWEVGFGTVGSGGTTLVRTAVYASSNSGSAVNFTTGTQDVFCDYPANKAVFYDSNGVVTIGSTPTYTDTGIIATFASSTAGYNQLVMQNTNSASNASTNITVTNNLGTSTTYFAEIGMNSSGFTGTGAFNTPNMAYFASASGSDLAIGTYGANAIHFLAGNAATDAMTITSGNVAVINSSPVTNVATAITTAWGWNLP
jgi:hypothetical protein